MPTSFLSLPGELRNWIYELVLPKEVRFIVPGRTSSRMVRRPRGPRIDEQIFLADQSISREVCVFVYSRNIFDFSWITPSDFARFFDRIGADNARCIRHICLDSKNFVIKYRTRLALGGNLEAQLAMLQSCCPSLSTVRMPMLGFCYIPLEKISRIGLEPFTTAVDLINTRLEALFSVDEIVVEADHHLLEDAILKAASNQGWTVGKVPPHTLSWYS